MCLVEFFVVVVVDEDVVGSYELVFGDWVRIVEWLGLCCWCVDWGVVSGVVYEE